jgi:hypothetical protein
MVRIGLVERASLCVIGFGGELEEWVVLRDDNGLYWFVRESLCVIGCERELEKWVF